MAGRRETSSRGRDKTNVTNGIGLPGRTDPMAADLRSYGMAMWARHGGSEEGEGGLTPSAGELGGRRLIPLEKNGGA